jgi:hypothetical protein
MNMVERTLDNIKSASFPRDAVLRMAQTGREKRITYKQLDNKVKPEQLKPSKTDPTR